MRTPADQASIIEVHELTKSIDNGASRVEILRGVNFAIKALCLVCLLDLIQSLAENSFLTVSKFRHYAKMTWRACEAARSALCSSRISWSQHSPLKKMSCYRLS